MSGSTALSVLRLVTLVVGRVPMTHIAEWHCRRNIPLRCPAVHLSRHSSSIWPQVYGLKFPNKTP